MGRGHINDTFLLAFEEGPRTVLQGINALVFPDAEGLMANMGRVTRHLQAGLVDEPDAARRALRLLPTRTGADFHRDEAGRAWRMVGYIEGSHTVEGPATAEQAYEAARALAAFQVQLADLPEPPLEETLPGFHDTRRHLRSLRAAAEADPLGRAGRAAPELAFAWDQAALAGALMGPLEAGLLPRRTVHNDTKLNNVLLDDATGKGLCVIDLDTVMPGTGLFDFGDLVRSGAGTVPEDHALPSEAELDLERFRALAEGTRSGLGGLQDTEERSRMAQAPQVIAFELGLRFLADHLQGDRIFRTQDPELNLHRARVQFALLRDMQKREGDMQRIVKRA
ncbi:MAG TPA: phosphotransferase [Holophagaceae bacterium]|nr:phosphotransferase [Holophagaceae bacterium]